MYGLHQTGNAAALNVFHLLVVFRQQSASESKTVTKCMEPVVNLCFTTVYHFSLSLESPAAKFGTDALAVI